MTGHTKRPPVGGFFAFPSSNFSFELACLRLQTMAGRGSIRFELLRALSIEDAKVLAALTGWQLRWTQ